jgi:hypothetical protein
MILSFDRQRKLKQIHGIQMKEIEITITQSEKDQLFNNSQMRRLTLTQFKNRKDHWQRKSDFQWMVATFQVTADKRADRL